MLGKPPGQYTLEYVTEIWMLFLLQCNLGCPDIFVGTIRYYTFSTLGNAQAPYNVFYQPGSQTTI